MSEDAGPWEEDLPMPRKDKPVADDTTIDAISNDADIIAIETAADIEEENKKHPVLMDRGDPNFNPHEPAEIEDLLASLLELSTDIYAWNERDEGNLENPADLGPTSLKLIEARIMHGEEAWRAADELRAHISAMVKLTEMHNEWSDFWSNS